MQIRGNFRFHSVGQGLFYSGLLQELYSGNNRRRFSFVYDCGTTSSHKFLRREADDFKELLPNWKYKKRKRLDLLIVSHLHKDHVNGLEYLLKNVEVDTVVMPYTDQAIRLLAWAESLTEFSDEEEFLRVFYTNPEGWFSARGVHRIMLIGAPRENDNQEYEAFPASLSHGREEDREDREDIWFKPDTILSKAEINDTELLMFDKRQVVQWTHYWKFRFSNLGLPKDRNYKKIVDNYLAENNCSLLDIFYSREKTMDLAAKLKKMLKSGTAINRTSLVTVHEPYEAMGHYSSFSALTPVHIGRFFDRKETAEIYSGMREFFERCLTTVLTGDIEINNEEEAEELGLDKIREYNVIQYPHHGAEGVLPHFVDEKLCRYALTVFSVGITNQYGHPDPEVLESRLFSVLVNERNAFDYGIISVD